MTHVDDLYEPGDDREPGEPEHQPPLSLEQIQGALSVVNDRTDTGDPYEAITLLLDVAVPQMLAELREARQRIAAFEALPTREEWTVTGGPNFPVEPGEPTIAPGEQAVVEYARRHETAQLWRRMLSVHPWEPISDKAPF